MLYVRMDPMECLFLLFCCNHERKLEIYHHRGLVLTTTSDRSLISYYVNVNDWCNQSSIQKFNENVQLCKSGKSFCLLNFGPDETYQQIFLKIFKAC